MAGNIILLHIEYLLIQSLNIDSDVARSLIDLALIHLGYECKITERGFIITKGEKETQSTDAGKLAKEIFDFAIARKDVVSK
jgi:hypothetical protein